MIYKGIAILGFGGHARSVADVALRIGVRYLSFVDEKARLGERFAGFPVVDRLQAPLPKGWAVFPAIGDNLLRRRQLEHVNKNGYEIATLVAQSAYVGCEAQIGMGVFVGNNAVVGAAVMVGTGSIVNTAAVVDHECVIGDFSHISVNVTVAGRSKIGSNVFIGAGATVIDKINISDNVIIGAGAVVIEDINEPGIYVGVPARRIDR